MGRSLPKAALNNSDQGTNPNTAQPQQHTEQQQQQGNGSSLRAEQHVDGKGGQKEGQQLDGRKEDNGQQPMDIPL